MPKTSNDRKSWRPHSDARRGRLRRLAARWGITLLAVGLMALAVHQVLAPLDHPNVHIACLDASHYSLGRVEDPTFGYQDAQALAESAAFGAGHPDRPQAHRLDNLASATAMQSLPAQLEAQVSAAGDVLVLYVDAQVVARDGRAEILCEDFNAAQLAEGYPLASLLSVMRQTSAGTRLLIIDSGRIESDPRLGMIVNEFARLLPGIVQSTGDRNLWVLASHGPLEPSLLNWSRERSVFSLAVERALDGDADRDGNHLVDMAELYEYVASAVTTQARSLAEFGTTQTPLLAWGGGPEPVLDHPPIVVPVGRRRPITPSEAPTPGAGKPSRTGAFRSQQPATGGLLTGSPSSMSMGGATLNVASPLGRPMLLPPPPLVLGGPGMSLSMASPKPPRPAAPAKPSPAPKPAADASATPSKDKPSDDAAPKSQPATAKPAEGSDAAAKDASGDAPADAAQMTAKKTNLAEQQMPELLVRGWELCDRLTSRQPGTADPIDVAPHLWRAFQERLVSYERAFRFGDPKDLPTLAQHLREELAVLEQPELAGPRTTSEADAPVAVRLAHLLTDVDRLARRSEPEADGAPAMPADDVALRSQLQDLAARDDAEEFTKWLAARKVEANEPDGLRLARRLAAKPDVSWQLARQALTIVCLAKQLPTEADHWLAWIEPDLEHADEAWLAAQRALFSPVYRDHAALAETRLAAASAAFTTAAARLAAIRELGGWFDDRLYRAPYYVRLLEAEARWTDDPSRCLNDAQHWLEELDRALPLWLEPSAANRDALAQGHAQRAGWDRELEKGLLGGLAATTSAANHAGRVESLLKQPLWPASDRLTLLLQVADAPPEVPFTNKRTSGERGVGALPALPIARWQLRGQLAQLETRLAKLAVTALPTLGEHWQAVDRAESEVRTQLQKLSRTAGTTTAEQDDSLWLAFRRLGTTLGDFERRLSVGVDQIVHANQDLRDPTRRPQQLRALRGALLASFLVDARDSRQIETAPGLVLRSAAVYDRWVFEERRVRRSAHLAEGDEAAQLETEARRAREAAVGVAQQPALAPAAAPPLEVLAPATLRLANRKSAGVELGLTSRLGQAQPTWIILHYDPAALEVAAPPDQRLYRAASGDELPGATAKTALPVAPHDVTTAAPSARLAPDSPIKLRFDVAARTSSREPLHIDVEAVTARGRAWRTIEVILPMPSPVDLFARGAPGTVVATDDGYSILPWPNRQTTFKLSLSSTTERARVVDVELLAAGADLADLAFAHALTSADADEMLAKVGHLETIVRLAEVKVPPRGESVQLKFPDRAVPPPEGTKPPVPAPEPAPAAMQPIAIADRLMVVVRERATDQVLVRRLIVAPQLPRRYVRPTVGYSRELERLFVRVEPQDRSLLPPGGVKVHLDIAEELPPATEGSFDARLDADNPRAELYVRMVPGDKTLTARVTVDGYPRAFVYRVPCRRPLQDVPEEIGLRNVEVLAPPANKSFGAPAASIPAEFRIDAPLGSFQRAGDFVEFGLDPNRNREFDGEPTLRFSNDRQVQVNLVRLASSGEFTLETAVGDFKVELPATGLRNGRVGVLGRLFVEGRSTYNRPREIILDAEGPRIDRVQLRPARPLVLDKDKEIEALVWVNDGDLSGAAGVQGLVDTQGLGKFAPDAKPVPGVQDPERHWLLKLPAAGLLPGTHRLLLRAIDKVGNSGPYKGIDFQLISEKEGAALQAQLVTGTVLYGDQGIADAKVTLAPAKGEKIEPVTTDAQGNFSFAKVPPGKYKLHAEAVVRNKTRKADAELEVAPAPAAVKPQRLVFK